MKIVNQSTMAHGEPIKSLQKEDLPAGHNSR